MSAPCVATAGDVPAERLDAFLRRFFPTSRADFLAAHGAWWHRSDDNRWVALVGGEIAGYCAVIPTRCRVLGESAAAVWWVDLVVAPEHRGEGLQRLFDQRVKDAAPLVLGFPNARAAAIHRRHGWGVRDDLRVRLAPLRPTRMRSVRARTGARLRLLAGVAAVFSPLAMLIRRRSLRVSVNAERAELAPGALATVFRRGAGADLIATDRDEAYLAWRYTAAPYRADLRVYVSEHSPEPAVAVIARVVRTTFGREWRILEVLGDLDDERAVRATLRLVVRDAVRDRATQVTMMTASAALGGMARREGFLIPGKARFCWWAEDAGLRNSVAAGSQLWSLGDSDNDEH